MADIYATRRERLLQLIQERFDWSQTKFAKDLRISRSSINEYASGAKTIGERVARRIEQAPLWLPKGWMDLKAPPGAVTRTKFRVGQRPKVPRHEVKKLLAAGYTQREIARQLGVYDSTVSRAIHGRKGVRVVKKERRTSEIRST